VGDGGFAVKRMSLLRNLIPALIVALVLGSSFVISAGANQGNNPDKNHQCGYGYTQADKDENGNEHGQNNDTKSHGEDNDRCEDEQGGEDNGGGGGGDNGGDNDRGGGRDGGPDNDRGGGRK
jgi:hypothetical protein